MILTTVFEAARQADCVRAAEHLGLRVRRSGGRAYACCLFHAERTPSMCLYPGDGGFYCFGCHEHGDAVALYGKALNLTPLEAARQVCRDFDFPYDEGKRRKRAPPLPTGDSRLQDRGPGEASRTPGRVAAVDLSPKGQSSPQGAEQPTMREAGRSPRRLAACKSQICARVAATSPQGAEQPTMREARALAKRLDALREQQADELLARLRAAQALMERAEAAHGDPEAVLDDADWRRAMAIRAAAQEQLAMLDGMTPAEYLKYIKEEDNEGRRDSGAIQAAGGG